MSYVDLYMETLLIEADEAVLPGGVLESGPVYVTLEGSRISGVFIGRSSSPVTDYPTLHTHLLCPGFVDTHTHGLGIENRTSWKRCGHTASLQELIVSFCML